MQLTSDGVEEHEVLEVGDLSPLPLLRHVGVAHQLASRHHGGPPATQVTLVLKNQEVELQSMWSTCFIAQEMTNVSKQLQTHTS